MDQLLQCALEAAERGGKVACEYFLRGEEVPKVQKSDGSYVTEADIKVEDEIAKCLRSGSGVDCIIAEEGGLSGANDADRYWIVDPIDGTRAFMYGVPLFGTLIALVQEGVPVVGVISYPAIQLTIFAGPGSGCFERAGDVTRRIMVDDQAIPLNEAVVSISGIHGLNLSAYNDEAYSPLEYLSKECGDLVFINDCYQHGMVCKGRIHCAIDTIMKPWDIAAIIPCIVGAGGCFSSLNGSRDNVLQSGSLISASNEQLLDQVVGAFRLRDGDGVSRTMHSSSPPLLI